MENPKPDFPIWKGGSVASAFWISLSLRAAGCKINMKGEVFLQRLAFLLTIFLWPVVALVWFPWVVPLMAPTEPDAEYLGGLRLNAAVVATLFVGLSSWLVVTAKRSDSNFSPPELRSGPSKSILEH